MLRNVLLAGAAAPALLAAPAQAQENTAALEARIALLEAQLSALKSDVQASHVQQSAQAQDIIRKYSGEWAAERFIATYDAVNRPLMEQLKSDPKRTVVFPSRSDLDTARAAFGTVTEEWLAKAPQNSEILKTAQAQLAKLRTTR